MSWDSGSALASIDYSVSADAFGDADASSPSVSYDGNKVAFASTASNLGPDTSANSKIFVRTLRPAYVMFDASTNAAGQPANGDNFNPSLSADGTRVAFVSSATNLVAGTPAGRLGIYVKNLTTGAVTRADTTASGTATNGSLTYNPSISGNGLIVAFTSDATNLAPGDANSADDLFVKTYRPGRLRAPRRPPWGYKPTDTATARALCGRDCCRVLQLRKQPGAD